MQNFDSFFILQHFLYNNYEFINEIIQQIINISQYIYVSLQGKKNWPPYQPVIVLYQYPCRPDQFVILKEVLWPSLSSTRLVHYQSLTAQLPQHSG